MADAFWISRHFANASCFDVFFHVMQNVIKLSIGNVALHLFVPGIIFPPVEPSRELSAPFERKLFDGSFDLGQTHAAILSAATAGCNARGESGFLRSRFETQSLPSLLRCYSRSF